MIDYYSNHEIGTKSDVWALGCFLYFICYFDLPYDDNKLAIVNAKFAPIRSVQAPGSTITDNSPSSN